MEQYINCINTLKKNGFKSILCNLDEEIVYDLKDNDMNQIQIKPNELLNIKNIFNGIEVCTGFFINGKRYFLKTSDNCYINGSSCLDTELILIERTNSNKCFVSIYNGINMENAEEQYLIIISSFFENNKHEIISNYH